MSRLSEVAYLGRQSISTPEIRELREMVRSIRANGGTKQEYDTAVAQYQEAIYASIERVEASDQL